MWIGIFEFQTFFSWRSADEAHFEGSGDPPPKKEKNENFKKSIGKFIFKKFQVAIWFNVVQNS